MKVSDWISSHPAQPVTITVDEPMAKIAAAFLDNSGPRDLYVVDSQGSVQGFVRHRRMAQILLAEHLPVQTRHQIMERVTGGGVAEELMERGFVSAHPGEELDNVLNRMLQHEVEDMPVVDDDNRIVGNINLTEVLRAIHKGEL